MMKSNEWGGKASPDRGKGSLSFLTASISVPLITLLLAVLLGSVMGTLDFSTAVFITGALLLILVLTLGQYEVAAGMIVVAHIYIDWFLGKEIVGTTVAVGLLFFLFIIRSSQHQWVNPSTLWLWGLFLVISIPPAIRGAQGSTYNLAYYYPNTVFGAMIMFWLGQLLARNTQRLRTLLQVLAVLGALLALHTIIQTTTGIVLFGTSHFDAYLATESDFGLGSNVFRSGSFMENPDWNGTLFALMLFIPVGLFAEANTFLQKCLYVCAILLMSIALFFTYSIGAWIGAGAGILVFILFAGRGYYRIVAPVLMAIIGTLFVVAFPTQIQAQYRHLSNPVEITLRTGAWETAINVIKAFPWTGLGLGLNNYLQLADPYRVPAQYRPLAHPHNSYLEWGAMAGLPVLIVFLILLFFAFWQAWRNWLHVDKGTRSLISGGMAAVVALSVNSLSINGWTLPPIETIGWLILGAIASPLLIKHRLAEREGTP